MPPIAAAPAAMAQATYRPAATGACAGPLASSARAVLHTMLYGNVTGRPYGWATPAETELMLSDGEPGLDTCPPGGQLPDWYLVPAADDHDFWLAWHDRRGQAEQWLRSSACSLPPPAPEMIFYCGTHRPWWLWSGEADYPLCVSYSTLRKVGTLKRGRVPWILDSRGFSELSQHGRWTIPAEDYVREVARYDNQIGGLQWAAIQDWMCEDEIINGGVVGRVRCVGTGLSEAEHQRRTVASFLECTGLWPRYSARPCPFIPIVQGGSPAAYLRCYQMYLDAGVQLGEEYPLVGVGSVCRLQATGQIAAVARALGPLGLELHWFGLKLTGLGRPEIQRDITDRYSTARTHSLDSASWSLDARYRPRLPGCTHTGRTGQPNKCNNCPRYAASWRGRVVAAMAAAQQSPARTHVQADLFAGDPWAGAR